MFHTVGFLWKEVTTHNAVSVPIVFLLFLFFSVAENLLMEYSCLVFVTFVLKSIQLNFVSCLNMGKSVSMVNVVYVLLIHLLLMDSFDIIIENWFVCIAIGTQTASECDIVAQLYPESLNSNISNTRQFSFKPS